MRFQTIGIVLALSAMVWTIGCGGRKKGLFTDEQMESIPLAGRYDLPSASGGLTMSLYSQTITSDEVISALEEQLRPAAAQMPKQAFVRQALPLFQDTVRSKVSDILLYEEARKKAPANVDEVLDKAVDQEVNRFVAGFGNNYALAEAEIRRMGMDWRTFREFQKKMIMTQSYLSSHINEKVPLTHGEMRAFYDSVRDEQFCRSGTVEFHTIDLVPGRLDADYIAEGQTARQAAIRLAETLAERARAGEDFAKLARTYSHGPLAQAGGKWLPVTVGANAIPEPYDVLETAALGLEPGQVSEPIVAEGHVFVVRLDSKELGGCKSFEEVQHLIERQLTFKHRQKQYEKFINDLVRQADMVEMERFSEFCAAAAYERWKKAG